MTGRFNLVSGIKTRPIMKTYLFALSLSCFSFLMASAQDDRKQQNDHTYSTHNYKHANKAAAARQWENKSGIQIPAPGFSNGMVANYKHQLPTAVQPGRLVVPHTPEMDVAVRNYKIQRIKVTEPTSQSASSVSERLPGQSILGGNQ